MPGENISPALREAMTVAPKNNRIIETMEIRQADALFAKRQLEAVFVLDTQALSVPRTNFVIWSNHYVSGDWHKLSNSGPVPTVSGDEIFYHNSVAGGGTYSLLRQNMFELPAGQYTLQAELKAGTLDRAYIYLYGGAFHACECNLTEEWQMFFVTIDYDGGGGLLIDIGANGDPAAGFQTLEEGTIHLRNVQVTNSVTPSEFIPTEAVPVTVVDSNLQTVFNNLNAAVDGVYSDLREVFVNVRWSLITMSGQNWVFTTGTGFTSYIRFKQKLAAIEMNLSTVKNNIFGSLYNFGASFKGGTLNEVLSRLNWTKNNDTVSRHIILLNDTPNETKIGMAPRVTFTSTCLYVYQGSSGITYWSVSCQDFPVFIVNEIVYVEGFANPENNGYYKILEWTESTIRFANIDGTPVTITPEEGEEITITTVDTAELSLPGSPEVVAGLLVEDEIAMSQGPSFGNADLNSIVTASGGELMTFDQMDTPLELRARLVELLTSSLVVIPGGDPIFIVNDNADLHANLENGEEVDFLRRNFDANLMGSGEDGVRSINVTIDNTDKKVSKEIARVKQRRVPLEITFRAYLANDLSQPQNPRPLKLYMSNSVAKEATVSGEAKWINVQTAAFPNKSYTRQQFPGLVG